MSTLHAAELGGLGPLLVWRDGAPVMIPGAKPRAILSQEGFDAQRRVIGIFMVEGDLYSRVEVFDEADLDTALARFDELTRAAAS